jgi:very-short-patch-repair endonuclease
MQPTTLTVITGEASVPIASDSPIARLAAVASGQLGLFNRRQASDAGIDRRVLARRRRTGELEQLTSRVFAIAGMPRTEEQLVLAAILHLGDGATASHWTAAGLWGFPGFRVVPIHVMDSRRRRDATSYPALCVAGRPVIVHTSRYLPPHHVTRLSSSPVVTPTRLYFQMAEAGMHPQRIARLVDRGWSRRLTSGLLLVSTFAELNVPGRRGMQAMAAVIEPRGEGYVPPASNLEARFGELTERRGLGPYRRQVDLGGGQWVARVDMVHASLPVVAEIDGDAYHLALTDAEADAEREARLRALGYEVVRASEFEVWHDPTPALDRLAAAEDRARRARVA